MRPGVLAGIGGFGALFEVPKQFKSRCWYRAPMAWAAAPGVRVEPSRHRGHRPGRHERQRHPGAGRRAAVLPGLLRLRQAVGGYGGVRGGRHRQGLRAVGMRADRRRDRRNARHVPGRRIRPGRLRGGRGGKVGHHRRQVDQDRRRGAGPGVQRRALQRLFAGPQDSRARQRPSRPGLPWPAAGRRGHGAHPHLRQAGAGRAGRTAPPSRVWLTSPAAACWTTCRASCSPACRPSCTATAGKCPSCSSGCSSRAAWKTPKCTASSTAASAWCWWSTPPADAIAATLREQGETVNRIGEIVEQQDGMAQTFVV